MQHHLWQFMFFVHTMISSHLYTYKKTTFRQSATKYTEAKQTFRRFYTLKVMPTLVPQIIYINLNLLSIFSYKFIKPDFVHLVIDQL